MCFLHGIELLSCSCGFDSRREHSFLAVMMKEIIAAFCVLGIYFYNIMVNVAPPFGVSLTVIEPL